MTVLHQKDRVLGAISLEVWTVPPKNRHAKMIDHPSDVNGGTLVLNNKPPKIVCSFIRRLRSLGLYKSEFSSIGKREKLKFSHNFKNQRVEEELKDYLP